MSAYFSFERMITTSFVKVVYFLGFLLLTAAGVALIVWAGLQLNEATIDRLLGWRYVASGTAIVTIGNIVWRVFCELWVVLFGIHDELVSVRHALNLSRLPKVVEDPVEREMPREIVTREPVVGHPAGILGLS